MRCCAGVVLNYFLDSGLNKAPLLFSGTGCAAVAILLGAMAHLQSQKQAPAEGDADLQLVVHSQRMQSTGGHLGNDRVVTPAGQSHIHLTAVRSKGSQAARQASAGEVNGEHRQPSAAVQAGRPADDALREGDRVAGAAQSTTQAQHAMALRVRQRRIEASTAAPDAAPQAADDEDDAKRSIGAASHSRYTGLAIAVFGGVVYSLFSPAFNVASNDPFHLLPPGVPALSIYATNFYFAASFTAFSVALNVLFLYRPPLGTQKSGLAAYLRDNDGRLWSVAAGLLAVLGDGTQFMSGQVAGYAAATVVQVRRPVSYSCCWLAAEASARVQTGMQYCRWGTALHGMSTLQLWGTRCRSACAGRHSIRTTACRAA